jgi:type IV secretory pathway VirB2 component (pilin)
VTKSRENSGCGTVVALAVVAIIALVAARLLPDLHDLSLRHTLPILLPILIVLIAAEAVRRFRSRG